MNLWGRRIVMFLAVLGAGPVTVQMVRRASAQSSAGAAVPRQMKTAAALSDLVADANTAPVSARSPGRPQPASAPAGVASSGVLPGGNARPAKHSSSAGVITGPSSMRTFHDPSYNVSFDFPANWTFAEKDHEISTFRLDARSADRRTLLRAVTAIPENPYPASTFTGAYVYLSVTPHSNKDKCAAQASPAHSREHDTSQIGGLKFAHGHDEQKQICTVERDEIYTTYRKGACYRFDLAINNFCGGEVSGVKDVTQQELDTVRARMESIMDTVRFDAK